MRKSFGFTLIEMIMTVSIVLILSSLIVPNFKAWFGGYRLRAATSRLMAVLQQARLYAVKTNARVIITFDPDNDGQVEDHYEIFVDGGLDNQTFWTREPDEKLIKRDRIPDGVEFHDVSFAGGKPRIRYDPLGLPNGFGGHIYLTNSQNRYLGIHVNINGNPRMVKSKDGAKGNWN